MISPFRFLAGFLAAAVLAALFVAPPAGAQFVSRVDEDTIATLRIGAVLGGSTTYSGIVVPRAVRFTSISGITSAAAVGAGASGFRLTDGTRTCDCLISCNTTGISGFGDAGIKRAVCSGSCSFPALSSVSIQSVSACGTTQPNVTYAYVHGIVTQ